jgi:hypothetical protein
VIWSAFDIGAPCTAANACQRCIAAAENAKDPAVVNEGAGSAQFCPSFAPHLTRRNGGNSVCSAGVGKGGGTPPQPALLAVLFQQHRQLNPGSRWVLAS